MSKVLVVGDPHADEKSLDELDEVFEEICTYKADILVILGDFWDRLKSMPTYKETMFGLKWARKFKKVFRIVYLLEGNHGAFSSTANNVEVLVPVLGEISTPKKFILEDVFFAHCMTEKSLMNFSEVKEDTQFTMTEETLNKYKLCFLGHQHMYQKVTDTIIHIGSCRYVTFAEANTKKYIALLDTEKLDYELIELKSVIPAVDVTSLEEINKLDERTKVRFVFKTFEQYKETLSLFPKFKAKFIEFKHKLDYKNERTKGTPEEPIEEVDVLSLLKIWLEEQDDKDIKELLIKALKAEGFEV